MLCTLLLPDLFLPRAIHDDAYRELPVPALERLLGRSDRTGGPMESDEAWLCREFGVARQADWPVAPLTLAIDGEEAGSSYWLRADPVHLFHTRNELLLRDASVLAVRPEEASALVAALNAHFRDDTQRYTAPHPQRWYLALAHPPQVATCPLAEAIGRDIRSLLPTGPDALVWHRTVNEIQMLLHGHGINDARERRGEPAINSIWLWGGGVRPQIFACSMHAVWSTDVLACALGRAAGLPVAAPTAAGQWLEATQQQGSNRHHLLHLDQLHQPARHGDLSLWRQRLTELEQAWFAPLLRALHGRRIERLIIVATGADSCMRFEVTGSGLLRFWRTHERLAAYRERFEP